MALGGHRHTPGRQAVSSRLSQGPALPNTGSEVLRELSWQWRSGVYTGSLGTKR